MKYVANKRVTSLVLGTGLLLLIGPIVNAKPASNGSAESGDKFNGAGVPLIPEPRRRFDSRVQTNRKPLASDTNNQSLKGSVPSSKIFTPSRALTAPPQVNQKSNAESGLSQAPVSLYVSPPIYVVPTKHLPEYLSRSRKGDFNQPAYQTPAKRSKISRSSEIMFATPALSPEPARNNTKPHPNSRLMRPPTFAVFPLSPPTSSGPPPMSSAFSPMFSVSASKPSMPSVKINTQAGLKASDVRARVRTSPQAPLRSTGYPGILGNISPEN